MTKSETGSAVCQSRQATRFPLFSRLPLELRRQIWEEAIYTSTAPRVHYYSFYNVDEEGNRHSMLQHASGIIAEKKTIPQLGCPLTGPAIDAQIYYGLSCAIQTSNALQRQPDNLKWAMANRFRYFWDGGLRTACTESREVYIRCFKKRVPWHGNLTLATGRDGTDEVQMHVNTRTDILCIRFSPDDMGAAARNLQWDILLASIPFYRGNFIDTANIAMEFESSWNHGLPGTYYENMQYEASHRGLFMRAFFAWAHGELPSNTRLWLIDKTWQPSRSYDNFWGFSRNGMRRLGPGGPVYMPRKFVDGRHEYVECMLWKERSLEYDSSALNFVWRLKEWYRSYRKMQSWDWECTCYRMLPSGNNPFCVAALRIMTNEAGRDGSQG